MAPPSATEPATVTVPTPAPTGNSQEAGVEKAKVKMGGFPKPPVFEDPYKEREYLKGRLAAAFRIFGKHGYDEGVAGHITLRDPVDPSTFWVNPFGVAFSQIKASDLIQVDHSGNVIDGGPCRLLNAAAFMIHSAIHAARPDVLCAAHSHSLYGRAFCTLGRPLDIITQDSCAFYNDHVVYTSFNGVVLAAEEGRNIAAALGDKKAALLQNHGLLTVGKSIEETVFWFVSLEKCCHAQLLADAAAAGRGGETVKINEADAAFTYKAVGTSGAGYFSAKPLFDVIHEETGGKYLE
ncbi:class II aldolase/adducin N-terminal [Aspergillus granulosus]|uniref:Class II aldolase/adducin N-terminal n=1 Tax=Aspergillus granulosus TaxID=176169 RepID=A0ABR4HM95_9EURO